MHMSFKSVCNKEYKGVICNMTSSNNSSQSARPTGQVLGKNYSSNLDLRAEFLSPEDNLYLPRLVLV